jgi:hypothetical protein
MYNVTIVSFFICHNLLFFCILPCSRKKDQEYFLSVLLFPVLNSTTLDKYVSSASCKVVDTGTNAGVYAAFNNRFINVPWSVLYNDGIELLIFFLNQCQLYQPIRASNKVVNRIYLSLSILRVPFRLSSTF